MLVIGIQNGFDGVVAKKTIKSGGNGFCWVKADDSGRFCINYEGRQIGEHCLPFLGVGRRLECSMRNSGVVE